MARYACAAIIVAGLTGGCFKDVREIPQPVPIEKECPTLEEQISPALYAPVRELGRREVFERGGLNRHLWLVLLEQEEELKYCNMRLDMIGEEIRRASDTDRE